VYAIDRFLKGDWLCASDRLVCGTQIANSHHHYSRGSISMTYDDADYNIRSSKRDDLQHRNAREDAGHLQRASDTILIFWR
jgi:hypothetical protein